MHHISTLRSTLVPAHMLLVVKYNKYSSSSVTTVSLVYNSAQRVSIYFFLRILTQSRGVLLDIIILYYDVMHYKCFTSTSVLPNATVVCSMQGISSPFATHKYKNACCHSRHIYINLYCQELGKYYYMAHMINFSFHSLLLRILRARNLGGLTADCDAPRFPPFLTTALAFWGTVTHPCSLGFFR
jgi:hypothetical protein